MKANENPTINDLQAQANEIKHLTAEQLEEVLTLAMNTSARDHAMLVMIYSHALRAAEASDLRLDAINWDSMEITVERKKGSLRTVQNLFKAKGHPALDEVKALKRYLTERKAEITDYVFASQKGGSLGPDAINRIFQGYVDKVNAARRAREVETIPESANHIHALKHTRCTLLIDSGMDFYRVGLIAGHAALSSTLKYTHGSQALACRDAQRAVDRMI